jgi:hypothetical protein
LKKSIAKMSFPLAIFPKFVQGSISVGERPMTDKTHNSMRKVPQVLAICGTAGLFLDSSR